MHFIGLVAGTGVFITYFCLKYIYVARSKGYASIASFKEVWEFSLKEHPKRRDIIPIKYIAIFFLFTGLFGWGDISHNDVANIWKPITIVAIYLNHWARNMIYESTHWPMDVNKANTALVIFKKSIQEIGWFPKGKDWLSRTVLVSGILIVLIGFIRIFIAFI